MGRNGNARGGEVHTTARCSQVQAISGIDLLYKNERLSYDRG